MAADLSFINAIISRNIAVADSRLTESAKIVEGAISAASGYVSLGGVVLAPLDIPEFIGLAHLKPPVVETVKLLADTDIAIATFASKLDASLEKFFERYFPVLGENDEIPLAEAEKWLFHVLSNKRLPLVSSTADDLIWERDRSRIRREAASNRDGAVSRWAARGFPLPPGAMMAQINMIDTQASDQIAQSSRERAIAVYNIDLENTRYAVDKMFAIQTQSLSAIGTYIKDMIFLPISETKQREQMTMDVYAKQARMQADIFGITTKTTEFAQQTLLAQGQIDTEIQKAQGSLFQAGAQLRANTTMAAAQALGQQGSAALNALSTNAGYTINANA